VSVFSPGAVLAINRSSGAIDWRRRLVPFGGSEVLFANSTLFAKSDHTLYALDPETGKEIWKFCPYGTGRETIYSAPTVSRGRVFIGDRAGYLHALDARTGRRLWSLMTSRAANNDVNGPPLIVGNLVLVATNAGRLVAADAKTGDVVWNRQTGGPSINEIARVPSGLLVATHSSLCWFDAESGDMLARRSFPGRQLMTYVAKGDRTYVVTAPKNGSWRELVGLSGQEIVFRRRIPFLWTLARVRSGIVEISFGGFAFLSPFSGERINHVQIDEECVAAHPAEYGKLLYIMTSKGVLWALRWPPSGLSARGSTMACSGARESIVRNDSSTTSRAS